MKNLPLDYIAGLIEGEGSFTWTFQNKKEWVPIFSLKMHSRDQELLYKVAQSLNIDNNIHLYKHQGRSYALLIVRDINTLLYKVIPVLDGRLHGYKKEQFNKWIDDFFYKKLINAELIRLCLKK